jgi:hypothetical protein
VGEGERDGEAEMPAVWASSPEQVWRGEGEELDSGRPTRGKTGKLENVYNVTKLDVKLFRVL